MLLAGTGLAAGSLLGSKRIRAAASSTTNPTGTIDRQSLVRAHNPTVGKIDPFSALTVGNGSFAFTADVTGLQTFAPQYRAQFPLCTCAHWAWHTTPIAAGVHVEDFRYHSYDTYGRAVGYPTDDSGQKPLFNWLRENPHRLHLGQIGLSLTKPDGSPAAAADITQIDQTLDLWTATLDSRFRFIDQPVRIRTCCHPNFDALAVSIQSPVVGAGRLSVRIAFPYGSSEMDMADWNSPDKHRTTCNIEGNRADLARGLDDDRYSVRVTWSNGSFKQIARHEFLISASDADRLDFVVHFSAEPLADAPPNASETFDAAAKHWIQFWSEGGAIDLSSSTDPRAPELQRRIILSQYSTALHCSGAMPPPESGLLFNTWYGKSHLEMHWWHGAHFAAWNRLPLLENSLGYYHRILPVAKAIAVRQGYAGVRWPKMVGPDGKESPSPIAPLLIWQQPHPIYFAELLFRDRPTRETLDQWSDIVFQTADFMASYAVLDRDHYVLGPPLKPVPENTETMQTRNPTFELAYWRFGLETAQLWRHRLGMEPDAKWADVLWRLSPLPIENGLYLMMEGMSDTYTKWNWEHPSLLGALGAQPGDGIDRQIMGNSLKKIMQVWQWDRCWGWDFPMAAMTAARLGEGELAVSALMIDSPKNHYHPNGHVYQRPNLPAYLPANGGLLAATAMMATHPAGFPDNGKWSIRAEGVAPLL